MCSILLCCLPLQEHSDTSDLSDMDDINEAVDKELLLLSNPWSKEGDSNQCSGCLWSLWCLLWSWPLEGQCRGWLMVRAEIPRVVLPRGISWMVKSKWLLGQQVYTRMPWSPCLHPAVSYSLDNCPLTFMNCHGVSGKVGWFPNPCICSSE